MRTLRRIAAALSSVLLLQLTLLGSGTLCAMRGTGGTGKTHDMSAMPGVETQGSAAAASAVSVRTPDRTDVPPMGGHSDEGCRLPWVPGPCTSMAVCSMTAMPSAMLVIALDTRPQVADLPMPGDLRSRPAMPPELPPPRA